jgi:hypothetical protein
VTEEQSSRKRRTRQHIIADQSVNCIQKFIIDAGFTSQEMNRDYGYDLTVNTFDKDGLIEAGNFYIQLKASETLKEHRDGVSYVFDLDTRDYRLWQDELMPVFLILYEAVSRRAYWLYFQRELATGSLPAPRKTAKTVRIRIPKANRVNTRFIRYARNRKADMVQQGISHA